jgi:uncharacterized protein (TIGR03435 family)
MMGTNLKQLISSAYDIGLDEIVGGPSWIDSLPYTIDAKADDSSAYTKTQLLQMIRPLLTDRFKLQFHNEIRQTPGYSLVVAKHGPKLKVAVDGEVLKPPAIPQSRSTIEPIPRYRCALRRLQPTRFSCLMASFFSARSFCPIGI